MKLNNNDDSHNSGLNLLIYNMLLDIESHPAWVCGLKPYPDYAAYNAVQSHPAWVCGLKHLGDRHTLRQTESHPAWVCGLKPKENRSTGKILSVTPCVGVWIETDRYGCISHICRHTLRGCVD